MNSQPMLRHKCMVRMVIAENTAGNFHKFVSDACDSHILMQFISMGTQLKAHNDIFRVLDWSEMRVALSVPK